MTAQMSNADDFDLSLNYKLVKLKKLKLNDSLAAEIKLLEFEDGNFSEVIKNSNFELISIFNSESKKLPESCNFSSTKLNVHYSLQSIMDILEEGGQEIEIDNNEHSVPSYKHPFINLVIPKELGTHFKVFSSDSSNKINIGIWSTNIKKWNVLQLDLKANTRSRIQGNVNIEYDNLYSDLTYSYKLNNNNTISINIYTSFKHDILEPKSLTSGGSLAHNFRFDRYNIKFYFFGIFDNDFDQ